MGNNEIFFDEWELVLWRVYMIGICGMFVGVIWVRCVVWNVINMYLIWRKVMFLILIWLDKLKYLMFEFYKWFILIVNLLINDLYV